MSRDVFISYKTEDKEAAERLCAALEREEISCWMAPRDIPPGQEWAASIVDGLQRSKSFVLLLSAHSVAAKQISREAELADKQNIPIITFRLEDVQPPRELLYFLGNIQWLEGFGGRFDSAAAQLANVIRSSANYPAPETHFPKTSRTADIPVSAPPPPPAVKLDPPLAKPAKRYLVLIAGGLLVLAAIGAWFALRRLPDHSNEGNSGTTDKVAVADPMQQAKEVADRFLKERDGGNYDAAWNEYSVSFHDRNKRDAWQKNLGKKAQETGAVTDEKFDYCKSSEQDVYTCEYTLKYNNGSVSRNDLWVIKNDKGGWVIDKGTFKVISP